MMLVKKMLNKIMMKELTIKELAMNGIVSKVDAIDLLLQSPKKL
ncbi:hypothetical protein ACH0CI_27450 [Priestia sp. 179-F W1.4 NHS]